MLSSTEIEDTLEMYGRTLKCETAKSSSFEQLPTENNIEIPILIQPVANETSPSGSLKRRHSDIDDSDDLDQLYRYSPFCSSRGNLPRPIKRAKPKKSEADISKSFASTAQTLRPVQHLRRIIMFPTNISNYLIRRWSPHLLLQMTTRHMSPIVDASELKNIANSNASHTSESETSDTNMLASVNHDTTESSNRTELEEESIPSQVSLNESSEIGTSDSEPTSQATPTEVNTKYLAEDEAPRIKSRYQLRSSTQVSNTRDATKKPNSDRKYMSHVKKASRKGPSRRIYSRKELSGKKVSHKTPSRSPSRNSRSPLPESIAVPHQSLVSMLDPFAAALGEEGQPSQSITISSVLTQLGLDFDLEEAQVSSVDAKTPAAPAAWVDTATASRLIKRRADIDENYDETDDEEEPEEGVSTENKEKGFVEVLREGDPAVLPRGASADDQATKKQVAEEKVVDQPTLGSE